MKQEIKGGVLKVFLILIIFIMCGFLVTTGTAFAAAVNTATNINVTPGTQFSTFMGVPVYRLHVAAGDTSDAITSLSPTPSGSANDTLITLHFYNDVNNNGYVDEGDIDLGASAAFASDNTIQTFDIADVAVPASGTANILITADGTGALLDTETFTLSFTLGATVLMTVEPAGAFPLANANALIISTSVPSLTIADGANDPVAKFVAPGTSNVAVKQWNINAVAGTSDSIVSLQPAPTGTATDNTDITSVVFYIDSGTTPGEVDGSDIQLVTTPTTYTADDTATIFTFSSPVQVPASGSINILMVYNLSGGVTLGDTLYAEIPNTGSVIAGSGTALTAETSTVSSLITIGVSSSITIESATLSLSNTGHTNGDMDGNGYANIGDHIIVWLTVSNSNGKGCNEVGGTVAYANLLKYGGGDTSSLICYTDNGGIHDLLATELVIANAGTDGIDVGVNSGSSVTLSVSDVDDSITTTTNNLGDGVDDTFTTLGVDTIAPAIVTGGTITLTDVNGDGIASIGDTLIYAADTETTGDTVTWTVDLSAYGFSDTAIPGSYIIAAGSVNNTVFGANETVTDDAGNTQAGAPTMASVVGFANIDNVEPTGSVALSASAINLAGTTQTVTVTYNEPMAATAPTIDFDHGTWSSTGPGEWDITGTIYTESFFDTAVGEFPTVTVSTSGATDVALNPEGPSTPGANNPFALSVQAPNIVYVDDGYTNYTDASPHLWGYDAFNNIQSGIDAVAEGGTVNVAAGVYDEMLTISTPAITLTGDPGDAARGPGANAPFLSPDEGSCGGPIISLDANDVTIEGFIIDSYCDTSSIRVRGNNAQILDNEITANYTGVGLSPNYSGATVSRNLLHDLDTKGIGIGGSIDNTISDNSIYDNTDYGINFLCGNEGDYCDSSGTVVENNEIYGNDYGIYWEAGNQASVVTVGTDNDLHDNNEGIYVSGDAGNLAIHGNKIHDNPGVASGLHVENTAFLDASQNWWGNATGPTIASNAGGTGETITKVDSGLVFYRPWCTLADCSTLSAASTTPSSLNDLLNSGSFVLNGGVDPSNITSIIAVENVTLTLPNGSSIYIPIGTVISKSGGGAFSALEMDAAEVDIGTLTGLGSRVTAEGALEWGIPTLHLEFNPAITLRIKVGSDLDSQTLDVKRSPDGGATWTSDGIVSPATCVVSEGICQFQATQASTYVSTTTGESASSGGSGSLALLVPTAPTEIPGCGDRTTGFSATTGQSCATNIPHGTQITDNGPFHFTLSLKVGSNGNEIMELQKFLNKAPYNSGLVADGKFGPKTKVAVIKFQLANGLAGDGVVGPKTRAVLNK